MKENDKEWNTELLLAASFTGEHRCGKIVCIDDVYCPKCGEKLIWRHKADYSVDDTRMEAA